MKKLLITFVFLTTGFAVAEESTLVLPAAESNQISTEQPKAPAENQAPAWRFQLGKTKVDYKTSPGMTHQGEGLTIGGAYQLNRLFAVNANFTNMKNEVAYDGWGESYKLESDTELFSYGAEISPIRYHFLDCDFSGSLLLGGISATNWSGTAQKNFPYYGGALTLNFKNQIGISLDTKVSREFQSMNQLSLVGYY